MFNKLKNKNSCLSLPYPHNVQIKKVCYRTTTNIAALLMKQRLPVSFSNTFRNPICQYISAKCTASSTSASSVCVATSATRVAEVCCEFIIKPKYKKRFPKCSRVFFLCKTQEAQETAFV